MNSTWLFYKLPKDIAGRRDLPASAKIVLAVLIDRIGPNACCWPGIRCLAKDSGLSQHAVINALRKLQAGRLVQIERRSTGQSNRYRVAGCCGFFSSGAEGHSAEPLQILQHNKKDQLNQTHIYKGHHGKQRTRYNRDFASQESSIGTAIAM